LLLALSRKQVEVVYLGLRNSSSAIWSLTGFFRYSLGNADYNLIMMFLA